MKKNLYTDGISKIKISQKALNKGLEAVRSCEPAKQVIDIRSAKHRNRFFKPVAAAAAVLAIAIASGTILSMQGSKSNPFVLTAGAKELNSETFVEIGNLDFVSNGSHWVSENDVQTPDSVGQSTIIAEIEGENGEKQKAQILTSQGKFRLEWIEGDFNLGIQCKGENIESVTYKINNGHFLVDDSYEGCISHSLSQPVDGYGTVDKRKLADACTFAYNMQPQSRLDFEVPKGCVDGSYPLMAAFRAEDTQNIYKNNPEKYTLMPDGREIPPYEYQNYVNDALLVTDLINSSPDEYSIDFTANFADGTTSTKTIVFRCEAVEDKNTESGTRCRLEAKIA